MIDTKYILSCFKNLIFEEGSHTYTYMGTKFKYSVSQYVHKFKKPFESDLIASRVSLKTGKFKQEILNQWENTSQEACRLGNNTHLFGELYAFNRDLKPKTLQEEAVVKFWNDLPDFIKPCIMELQVFCKDRLIAGTVDILLKNEKTGNYIIADYKTNKDLFKNFKGQKMLKPFDNFLDTPFNSYQLQLSLYKLIFESVTKLKVERTRIVWLKNTGEYLLYDTGDFTEILDKTLL